MPPVSGYETIADHISNLVAENADLRRELGGLRESTRWPNNEHITDLREDIYDVKNILLQSNTIATIAHSVPIKRMYADIASTKSSSGHPSTSEKKQSEDVEHPATSRNGKAASF